MSTHTRWRKSVKRTPEVVVSAGRFPLPANQVGSAVTVVTSEDMEREQATRVIDVLRKVPGLSVTEKVPGLSVTETGGPGAQASIFMRGMSSYNTQLLIDGVEMADTSAPQPAYDFGHLLVADIERIEIVRVQSVLRQTPLAEQSTSSPRKARATRGSTRRFRDQEPAFLHRRLAR